MFTFKANKSSLLEKFFTNLATSSLSPKSPRHLIASAKDSEVDKKKQTKPVEPQKNSTDFDIFKKL